MHSYHRLHHAHHCTSTLLSGSLIILVRSGSKQCLLLLQKLLLSQAALVHLTRLLLSRLTSHIVQPCSRPPTKNPQAYLQHLPGIPRTSKHLLHILWEPQISQRLIYVLDGDRLLLLLLRYFVGFGGY